MKHLTEEEFQDRTEAILRSRRIFIDSGMTKNITLAFGLYQAVLADREREILLSTNRQGNRPHTIFDQYERVPCPDCGADMFFRQVLPNDEGIKCQLVCGNRDCPLVLNSDNDLSWWAANLRKKTE